MDISPIEHVSDTALWVASFRARETDRPDAVFRDPLAARLIGERGQRIADAMPNGKMMAWVMVLRTSAIDRLILQSLALGCDTVLNLGAGLDTRPYRLSLPAKLRWIEVDFPDMVQFKDEQLASETPACLLERIAVDLSDAAARRALLDRVAATSKRIVVLTEGVLPYLTNDEATALARDLRATERIAYWIHDFQEGEMLQRIRRAWGDRLKSAPMRLDIKDWFAFCRETGWTADETVYSMDEAKRLRRWPPFIFPWSLLGLVMGGKGRDRMRRMTGYVRVRRAD